MLKGYISFRGRVVAFITLYLRRCCNFEALPCKQKKLGQSMQKSFWDTRVKIYDSMTIKKWKQPSTRKKYSSFCDIAISFMEKRRKINCKKTEAPGNCSLPPHANIQTYHTYEHVCIKMHIQTEYTALYTLYMWFLRGSKTFKLIDSPQLLGHLEIITTVSVEAWLVLLLKKSESPWYDHSVRCR